MQFVDGFSNPGGTPRPSVFGNQCPPPVGQSRLHPAAPWGSPPLDSSMPGVSGSWLHTTPAQMPWGINQPSIVRFTGEQAGSLYGHPFKRKKDPELEMTPASKRLMTEEHMAANMSNLRISNRYGPGRDEQRLEVAQAENNTNEGENEEVMKRLFVCDELTRFKDEILPSAILCKLQKPSTALMLWQPPSGMLGQPLQDSILSGRTRRAAEQEEEEGDNNNASALNLNTLHAEGYRDVSYASEDMDL